MQKSYLKVPGDNMTFVSFGLKFKTVILSFFDYFNLTK